MYTMLGIMALCIGAFFLISARTVSDENSRLVVTHRKADAAADKVNTVSDTIAASIPQTLSKLTGSVDSFQRGINSNLNTTNDILDGQLGYFNATARGFAGLLIGQADYFTDQTKNVADSVAIVADRTGEAERLFTKQFLYCDDNPGCLQSRWLALSGEAMKTMDSSRRMMGEIEHGTPQFIDEFHRLNEQGIGIATDVHKVTDRYVNPSKKSKALSALTDAARLCGLLCK